MEFKELCKMLHNRISDGADIPYFVRDLIAMITDVPEEEWGTPKDPSTKTTNENTLRNFSKRGLSKKLAKNIVYRLKPENFIDSINSRDNSVRKMLANDYKTYNPLANENNIGTVLADEYVEIIRRTAGLVEPTVLEKQKHEKAIREWKDRYGEYLLNEVNHTCPFPGCGRSLVKANNGNVANVYDISLVDKSKSPDVENLIAMCPQCCATYSIDTDKKVTKQILSVKRVLVGHNQNVALLDDLNLERGIVGVLTKIKKLNQKDLYASSMDPKGIVQKVNPEEDFALYMTINNYVNTYFVQIKKIMTDADKRGEIEFDEIQRQIHAMYKRLDKAKKSKIEIFNEISQKIHKVSLMEDIYCQIVVAYFVQICEVFDAIS